jgi:hypothetical protein
VNKLLILLFITSCSYVLPDSRYHDCINNRKETDKRLDHKELILFGEFNRKEMDKETYEDLYNNYELLRKYNSQTQCEIFEPFY